MTEKFSVVSIKTTKETNLFSRPTSKSTIQIFNSYPCKPQTAHSINSSVDGWYIYFVCQSKVMTGDWVLCPDNITVSRVFGYDTDLCVYFTFAHGAKLPIDGDDYRLIVSSSNPSLNLPKIPEKFIQKYCEVSGRIEEVFLDLKDPREKEIYGLEYSLMNIKINSDNEVYFSYCTISESKKETKNNDKIPVSDLKVKYRGDLEDKIKDEYCKEDSINFARWIHANQFVRFVGDVPFGHNKGSQSYKEEIWVSSKIHFGSGSEFYKTSELYDLYKKNI